MILIITAQVFVDTNIFVYRQDALDPVKQSRAEDWLRLLVHRRCGRLSFQILQELYSTLTRKLKPGIPAARAQQIVRDLIVWQPVTTGLATLERAWFLQERYSVSWWDALIIAAAQSCECRALLTEDLQHGQIFGEVQVINPFEAPDQTPAEVLEVFGP